ncbi:hypothetical protein [Thalassotalea agarivorans]|uniref:Uncharacterized protein n=1 Tax=Thalassotalea agarivorans TaxID=349064 RepID=A0A1I0G695_THASX|nr:hypothetical protein [Thalassotalea agarivorans]SET66274.1 hypothetical protein SAMN05660429_02328 [Thalassotalea agarivorans]
MTLTEEQLGKLQTILTDFEQHQLPRLLDLEEHVNDGGTLNEFDITFMEQIADLAKRANRYAESHPDYQEFVAKMVHLYEQITEKALENEKSAR